MIDVSSKRQQQHENSDSTTNDRSPSSLFSSSSTTTATTPTIYHFLHRTCRRTSVRSILAVLIVSLWNVALAPRYSSQYSTSSTDGYSAIPEMPPLLQQQQQQQGKKNQQPPPPWSTQNSSTFMSSCLMWMDDNHYLVEWLAYHHTVLPLRRLIICIDPKSQTSPLSLLERYLSRGLMNITVWNEDDFFPKEIRDQWKEDPVELFLERQNNCYLQCMKTLKEDYTIPQKNHSATPPPTQHHPYTANTTTTANVLVAPKQPGEEEESEQQQPPIWVLWLVSSQTIFVCRTNFVVDHDFRGVNVGFKAAASWRTRDRPTPGALSFWDRATV
jgi:hypothetical protein